MPNPRDDALRLWPICRHDQPTQQLKNLFKPTANDIIFQLDETACRGDASQICQHRPGFVKAKKITFGQQNSLRGTGKILQPHKLIAPCGC